MGDRERGRETELSELSTSRGAHALEHRSEAESARLAS
jgi:hypothetical protein